MATQDCRTKVSKKLCKIASSWKEFLKFCSSELHSVEFAIFSSLSHLILLFILGRAYNQIFLKKDSETLLLSLWKASTNLFWPSILNAMFIVNIVYEFAYRVPLVQPPALRVPVTIMLSLNLLYGLSIWVVAASMFDVIVFSFKMNGILFVSLWIPGFTLLYFVLTMFVFFVIWSCTKQNWAFYHFHIDQLLCYSLTFFCTMNEGKFLSLAFTTIHSPV